jgi:hypothetical protein
MPGRGTGTPSALDAASLGGDESMNISRIHLRAGALALAGLLTALSMSGCE